MKYLILVLVMVSIFVGFGNQAAVEAAARPRPTPTPTRTPEVSYNWKQATNAALLTERGDYSMPWWSWFGPRNRPNVGIPYILMNHGTDKFDWTGYSAGSAFNPNGATPSDLVEFIFKGQLVSFDVYKNVSIVAPGRGYPVIVIAQTKGPYYNITPGCGIPMAGVRVFLGPQNGEFYYQKWLSKVNP